MPIVAVLALLIVALPVENGAHAFSVLRADILRFFGDGRALAAIDDDDERAKVSEGLAQLDVAPARMSGALSPLRYSSR